MSELFNVCAPYREGRRGKAVLAFAGSLAARLGVDCVHVYLPVFFGACPELPRQSARDEQKKRVAQQAETVTGVSVIVHDDVDLATVKPGELPEGAIVVSNDLALRRTDISVLQPFEESSLARSGGGVLVPFGDGESGLVSAEVAVPLARALSLDVIFYHTTWPLAGVPSKDAHDHLAGEARSHYERLRSMAEAAGVKHEFAIEMADDVVFGMLACAYNGAVSALNARPASLVVMSHGLGTCLGSYVEKALVRASTPILVVPSTGAGGTT
jgi:hypothetical protein